MIAPVSRYAIVSSVNWAPLEMPLPAGARTGVPGEFTVEYAGRYELALKIDRPPDKARSTHAECQIGFDWVECAEVAPVGLRWYLESHTGRQPRCDDELRHEGVVEGRSLGGRFTPTEVERWLGCFDAEAGARYALRVDGISNVAALESLNPRFVVLPSSTLDREQHSFTAAVWVTALLVGLAGVLVLFA